MLIKVNKTGNSHKKTDIKKEYIFSKDNSSLHIKIVLLIG